MNFITQLKKLNACSDGIEEAKQHKNFYAAWRSCKRGDWLMWLVVELKMDHKKIVLAACDCAELSLHFAEGTSCYEPAKHCLEVARAWCRGEVTIEEVRKAAHATRAAYSAACAAACTAYVAARAARAASRAAYAAARAAGDAAYYKTLSDCAQIVRKHFKYADVKAALEAV